MALAIFDLDNTLLGGDSDYLWGRYLAENAIVDPQSYHDTNLAFYNDYQSGQLDINAFLQFVFEPLAKNSMKDLLAWRADYLQQKILPIILPKGLELIEQHRQQGDTLLIITATNSFLTTPIAELLKIDNLIATDPEMLDGRYTGKVFGVPSFQHGKVERLQHWLDEHQQDLAGSYFYSDSHNDLPLLEQVDTPIAVDPDDKLAEVARQRDWKILSLRE
ncbi:MULTISPECIES: HAD family hydrolase [unclassified Methylophaga]|jgi:HAD superfamily hydrolase (TIGR01490 family)|uniref:histidinol-phosphatase n=1 Tax=unclassified Methylophaga TaxID=2629249 RepID=UPI000C4A0E0D|nr:MULTISPECIES: HAD family hydrolase [unclassified Methylophaga]MAL49067.1 HAD-IB family hydrolase [Methylophaga sp.]MAP27686.1 HAD-IB family hydrolase [Methylophaga sp.]MBP25419.1 HAD-IB family hydrolase [Methylophaga sp.]HAD32096.1 HAD-IB family hydrolase [Methylophaga sp.]HCC83037.1 HAD-IB family hydrolase [Methylophaga sp.]|tara:strand:- start:695 stop:1351 length:657 start_codon:yes stop_codon:yes gene_type:complete